MGEVQSWKNPEVRWLGVLGAGHPAGDSDFAELTDLEMSELAGAHGTGLVGTFGCCWCVPWYSGWTVCGVICSHPGCKA